MKLILFYIQEDRGMPIAGNPNLPVFSHTYQSRTHLVRQLWHLRKLSFSMLKGGGPRLVPKISITRAAGRLSLTPGYSTTTISCSIVSFPPFFLKNFVDNAIPWTKKKIPRTKNWWTKHNRELEWIQPLTYSVFLKLSVFTISWLINYWFDLAGSAGDSADSPKHNCKAAVNWWEHRVPSDQVCRLGSRLSWHCMFFDWWFPSPAFSSVL